jgi:tetratricopeptide (TPR) repeat protein
MKALAGTVGSVIALSLALGALRAGASPSPSPLPGAAGAGSAAKSAPMSGRAARAAIKNARAAMKQGRLADALGQYESVLASTPPAEDARGEALYWAGFLRISPDPALRDFDRARTYLGELKVFHGGSGHQDEAAILLALTEEIGEANRTAESLRAEVAARGKDNESCRAETDSANGKLQAALSENGTLKESDSAHRAEIQGLREEIARKDEALRKVKEVVVGWKAPR